MLWEVSMFQVWQNIAPLLGPWAGTWQSRVGLHPPTLVPSPQMVAHWLWLLGLTAPRVRATPLALATSRYCPVDKGNLFGSGHKALLPCK